MLRRTRRLAKQYCFRKSKETLERTKYEKKRKITASIQEGKPIPNELRNEEAKLRQEIDLEDDNTAVLWTHIDDEYAKASKRDPKILLTTSRDPSAPLLQFTKELKLVFPNAQVLNRGGQIGDAVLQVLSEIVESCRAHDYSDVVLVHEQRGKPNCLSVCHLPYGPTAYFELCNVVSRHDIKDKKAIGTVPQAYPHLIINNFTTKLGERTANILKHLFPVPKPDTKRIITFTNKQDYILFRHHIYDKPGGPKSVELKEIGLRFELKLFKIKLGTVDQYEAQDEWVLKPYMNTAKKQKYIGNWYKFWNYFVHVVFKFWNYFVHEWVQVFKFNWCIPKKALIDRQFCPFRHLNMLDVASDFFGYKRSQKQKEKTN